MSASGYIGVLVRSWAVG